MAGPPGGHLLPDEEKLPCGQGAAVPALHLRARARLGLEPHGWTRTSNIGALARRGHLAKDPPPLQMRWSSLPPHLPGAVGRGRESSPDRSTQAACQSPGPPCP